MREQRCTGTQSKIAKFSLSGEEINGNISVDMWKEENDDTIYQHIFLDKTPGRENGGYSSVSITGHNCDTMDALKRANIKSKGIALIMLGMTLLLKEKDVY